MKPEDNWTIGLWYRAECSSPINSIPYGDDMRRIPTVITLFTAALAACSTDSPLPTSHMSHPGSVMLSDLEHSADAQPLGPRAFGGRSGARLAETVDGQVSRSRRGDERRVRPLLESAHGAGRLHLRREGGRNGVPLRSAEQPRRRRGRAARSGIPRLRAERWAAGRRHTEDAVGRV